MLLAIRYAVEALPRTSMTAKTTWTVDTELPITGTNPIGISFYDRCASTVTYRTVTTIVNWYESTRPTRVNHKHII